MSTPLSFAHCIYKFFFLVPMLFTANLQKQRNVQTCLPCVEKTFSCGIFAGKHKLFCAKQCKNGFACCSFFVHGKADLFKGRIVMLATNFFVRLQLFATFCRYLKDVDRKLFAKSAKTVFCRNNICICKNSMV